MSKFKPLFRIFRASCIMSSATTRRKHLLSPSIINIKRFFCSKEQNNIENGAIDDPEKLSEEVKSLLHDSTHKEFHDALYKDIGNRQNVYFIQPRIRFGPNYETKQAAELKIDEAVALIDTLPGWKVMESNVISVENYRSKYLFGSGNLEMLRSEIRSVPGITAVFIGINLLSALQNVSLDKYFGLKVFDRYQIVLQIFHIHAHTKEARLQVALAEIPYLKIKLSGYSQSFHMDSLNNFSLIGGTSSDTLIEKRKEILFNREVKLKKALEKLKKKRQFLRKNEKRNEFPIIAVVGYTNCGKTTLIKSLTEDARLIPEDKLFATLDVTLHAGLLPSSQRVLYIDTVGFISDVPTALIQSFKSTLEDIAHSDLIVHVRDISNPNTELQKKVVLETLNELELPQKLLDSIIEVGNKIDLIENCPENSVDENRIDISATKGTNLQHLAEEIENKVLENTGFCIKLIRVPNGGEEYRWLNKEAAIKDSIVDESDYNFLILEVVISLSTYEKFKHYYGDLSVTVESLISATE